MVKKINAPKSFYTASEAIKKLNMPRNTFFNYVRDGRIKKVIPPGQKEGFYLKANIDKLAQARELFMLQYAVDTSIFEQAQEDDIAGIADLNTELFGGNRETRYDLRMSQYRANLHIFHVLKQDGIIVGYVGIFPLKQEAIDKIMSGMPESRFRTEILAPECILPFEPGKANNVFLIIGVKQGVKKSRLYGARVITGTIEFLETLARRGIFIKKAYGTSRTQEGIRLASGLGFKQITPVSEEDNLLRYELDLLASNNPLLQEYQIIVKQASNKKVKIESK